MELNTQLNNPAINKNKLKNLAFSIDTRKWGKYTLNRIDWPEYAELYSSIDPNATIFSNDFLNINTINTYSNKRGRDVIYVGNIEGLQPKFKPFVMKSDIAGVEAAKLVPPEPVKEPESKPKPKSNVKPPLSGLSCIADICGVGNVKVF